MFFKCYVYLFNAALYMLYFVLHTDALFHCLGICDIEQKTWRQVSKCQATLNIDFALNSNLNFARFSSLCKGCCKIITN